MSVEQAMQPHETDARRAADNEARRPREPVSAPAYPQLDDAVFHGLLGRITKVIAPHTEADEVAILGQLLVAVGNAIGHEPHFVAEADRHALNLFAVLVGETAKGRKGTSWGHAKRCVIEAEPAWARCIACGLSSGEGLIWQVRDPIEKREPIKEKGRVVDYQEVVVDEGVDDKRLLVHEGEFASTLRVLGREGNTLSAVMRNAWDTGDLRTLTKNAPATASGAHVSIIGHITQDELRHDLDRVQAGNGFGNRFLWFCVRRSKMLPEGGSLRFDALVTLLSELKAAVQFGSRVREMRRDEKARQAWIQVYGPLSEGKPGLVGAMTARAEAQVMRLACIYALMDRSAVVHVAHLRAALAVWEYAEQSVH